MFKTRRESWSAHRGFIGELGHAVQTVSQEQLKGIDDVRLFEICTAEAAV